MTEEQLRALEAVFGTAQEQTQGISPAQQDILSQILGAEQAQSVHNVPAPNPAPEIMGALGLGTANGLSGGFADNLAGALFGGALGGDVNPQTGEASLLNYDVPTADRYAHVRDDFRGDLAHLREAQPGAALTGDLLGGAATSLAMAPNLAGKTFLRTLGKLAGWGAAEGAVTGAGYSDAQTWGDLGAAALKGAEGGLLAAPAGAAIAAGLSGPLRSGLLSLRGKANDSLVARRVAGLLPRASKTPAQIEAEMAQAAAEGQPMFTLADALGRPGQRAAGGIVSQPGKGGEELAAYLSQRQLDQADRVSGFVQDALGANETATQATQRLTGVRNTEADALWGAAREGAGPVDVRGAVAAIDTRLGPMRDSGVALSPFDRTLDAYRNRLTARTPPDGTTAVDLSDFSRVHEIRRDLADDIEAARRAGRNNEAAMLGGVRAELDRAMEGASEPYRRANDTFADRSRVIDAVGQGQGAATARHQDSIDTFRGLLSPQQGPVAPGALPLQDAPQAFRTGYADKRLGQIERGTPGKNAALPFTSTRDRAVMDEIAYDPERFRRQIDREMEMNRTGQKALGNSVTAERLADQQDVNGAFEGIAVLADTLQGRFGMQAALSIVKRLASAGTGLNEATRTALARALMSTDPKAALAPLLRQAQASEGQMRAAEAFVRSLGYAETQRRGLLSQ